MDTNLSHVVAASRLLRTLIPLVALCSSVGCGDSTVAIPIAAAPSPAATLSSDQQIYQGVESEGGEFTLEENVPFGGGTLTAQNGDYFYSISSGGLTQSPLTAGPQIQTQVLSSLDGDLSVTTPTPTRVLQAGRIWVVPSPAMQRISYVGDRIQLNVLAQDGETTLHSYELYNFSVVPLSGAMGNASPELLAALPVEQWISFSNFSSDAIWQPGAEYIKRQGRRLGDVVFAEDCAKQYPAPPPTTTTLPRTCASGATLAAGVFPISLLSSKDHPTETDFFSDGKIISWQGTVMWVGRRPLPRASNSVESYRVFFELDGNIYMGRLEKDGTPFGYTQADGSRVSYQVVYNQAAVMSVQAGLVTGSVAGGPEDPNPPPSVPTPEHVNGFETSGVMRLASKRV